MTPGNYVLYIMVSDSNPFDTANLGTIHKYPINYEKPKWEFMLVSIKMTILIILLAIMF